MVNVFRRKSYNKKVCNTGETNSKPLSKKRLTAFTQNRRKLFNNRNVYKEVK
jgi:hypothetical protein